MEIRQIINKDEWENFVLSQLNTFFVQSIHYGEFYEKLGEKFWIFGVYENDKLLGGSLVVSVHAKRGNFLYLPYGPICGLNHEEEGNNIPESCHGTDGRLFQLVNYLKVFAKNNQYDFIRFSPFIPDSQENRNSYKQMGFRPAPMHILAETTWLLDLSASEEELLAAMNKNHRNLIRRCEREGVKIVKSNNVTDLEKFNQLHDETAKRHNFHRFSNKYILDEFSVFASQNQASVFNATLPSGELDSSAIIMYYGNMAAYRHGASLNLNPKLPSSYLLQWEAIKEAKRQGIRWYNFWGIAPEGSSPKHPFYGITHFKKGFGGMQKDLLHCHDLPITKKYWLNWLIESIRKINRGF